VAPIVPAITDHETAKILEAAADAGATSAGYVVMRLPGAVPGLFEEWVERHFPDRKEKVLNRIRDLRGGKLNDPRFGSRMRGEGIYAEQIRATFETLKRRYGLDPPRPEPGGGDGWGAWFCGGDQPARRRTRNPATAWGLAPFGRSSAMRRMALL